MKAVNNHFLTGLLAGMAAPVAAFWIFFLLTNTGEQFLEMTEMYVHRRVITHIISLSAIANLLLFFAFLRFHLEASARGVIGATFIYVIIVLYIKFC